MNGESGVQSSPARGPHLETVIIFTPRMEELANFYQEALELGPYNTSPGHMGQSVGTVYLGFDLDPTTRRNPHPTITLWFTVDDIQATFDRLLLLGAEALYAPTRKPWGALLAAVYDPDGNMIGLSQREN